MERGIALLFLYPVRDQMFIRNIEIRNPDNYIDIKNRGIVEFPKSLSIHDVVHDHLLFRRQTPVEWYTLRDLPLSKEPPVSTQIWFPAPPVKEVKPEITFHVFGEYVLGEVTYTLVAIEAYQIDICLKNQNTVLGGPIPPDYATTPDDPDIIRTLVAEYWEKLSF